MRGPMWKFLETMMKMHPGFVDKGCQQAIVLFDEIDDEDMAEDEEYGIEDEYEGED